MSEQYNVSGRLYTFGCSMTRYRWPTWADIVGTCWNKFENWAQPGAGNQYIFNSIMECNARNNFNSDDTILIMWSGISRIDYYQSNAWGHLHSTYPEKNKPEYPVCCPDGYEILSFAYMRAIEEFLKSKKVTFEMLAWHSYKSSSDAYKLYSSTIKNINVLSFDRKQKVIKNSKSNTLTKELYDRLYGPDWPSLDDIQNNSYCTTPEIQIEINEFLELLKQDKKLNMLTNEHDCHPTPLAHLKTAQNIFKNLTIPNNTVEWIEDIDQQLLHGKTISFNANLPATRL